MPPHPASPSIHVLDRPQMEGPLPPRSRPNALVHKQSVAADVIEMRVEPALVDPDDPVAALVEIAVDVTEERLTHIGADEPNLEIQEGDGAVHQHPFGPRKNLDFVALRVAL